MELLFLGDMMFGWKIKEMISLHGPAYPFQQLNLPLITEGLIIGNLETVVSDLELPSIRLKNDKIISPAACLQSLQNAGITCVSLANNHVFDYGYEGLEDTLRNLEKQGITAFGAGMTRQQAQSIRYISHEGQKIGLLSRTFTCESANPDLPANRPQAAELRRNELLAQINMEGINCDLLVVVLHFGYEYCRYPDYQDVEFCRALIDQGADLVIGHHPHVFQGIERYKQGLIAYSLGNFIFDNTLEDYPETAKSIQLKVSLTPVHNKLQVIDYEIMPIFISTEGQVYTAPEPEKEKIMQQVSVLSSAFILDIKDYRKFSDSHNADIIMAVRKKEIIRKIKTLQFRYLIKKAGNIRWIHIRIAFSRFMRMLTSHSNHQ